MYRLNGKAPFEPMRSLLAGGFAVLLLALAGAQAASAQGAITNLSPSSVPAGSPGFNLVVTAVNLPANGVHLVYLDGAAMPTSANGNQFTIAVPASLVALPASISVTVQTNGVPTPAVAFAVAGPVITSLSPPGVAPGHADFTLTINGSGFVPCDSEFPGVYFDGNFILPTYIGSTQLQVLIPAALVVTAGIVDVIVEDVDPLQSTSPPFPFTIGLPFQILTQGMPAGQVGTFYNFTFQTANGLPPMNFTATGLPGSLSLNPATGAVTGTPNAAGVYGVSLLVTDSGGGSVARQFVLNVAPPYVAPLAFGGGPLPPGQLGVPYSGSVSAIGGVPPYTFGLAAGTPASPGGTLPPGLTIFGSGGIGGTPTTVGSYKFTLQVTDSAGTAATQGYTLTIAPPPLAIATGALSSAPAASPLTIVFTATGGYPGYTFSADPSIPFGMTFNSGGTLTGAPTTPGTYKFNVYVKDNSGATASKAFTLVITPPAMVILTTALPGGQAGVAYSVQFYAANGQPPYAWTATGLPTGLAISGGGLLSGTPASPGTFTVAVTATDTPLATAGVPPNQAIQSYTLIIAPAPLLISTASLPAGVAGTAYAATLTATGGVIPYTWTVQGLPSGIIASASGALSGAAASAGSSTVTATVTDSKGVAATGRFILQVAPAPISITTASLPNGTVQTAYSVTLTAAGGAGSNQWTATGLPAGLTISPGGAISGAPTTPGVAVVAVTVTDAAGTVAVQTYKLTIAPLTLAITTTSLPAGITGTAYSATLAATGGVGSNQWTATGLPSGLTMGGSGAISGAPTAAGAFTVAVTVTDASGSQAKQTYTLTVALAPLAITTTTLPAGVVGTAYSATLAANGGTAPYSWTVQGLPSGIIASASGALTGAVAAAGTSTVTATVTDAKGATAAARFTLVVAAAPLAIIPTS
jgi:hypothetical protein